MTRGSLCRTRAVVFFIRTGLGMAKPLLGHSDAAFSCNCLAVSTVLEDCLQRCSKLAETGDQKEKSGCHRQSESTEHDERDQFGFGEPRDDAIPSRHISAKSGIRGIEQDQTFTLER